MDDGPGEGNDGGSRNDGRLMRVNWSDTLKAFRAVAVDWGSNVLGFGGGRGGIVTACRMQNAECRMENVG